MCSPCSRSSVLKCFISCRRRWSGGRLRRHSVVERRAPGETHPWERRMPDRSALLFPVRTYELDAAGQVLPATYLRWFQEAAIFASAANGFDEARYQELGSTWFVREFHLEIIGSPRPGDRLCRLPAACRHWRTRPRGALAQLGAGRVDRPEVRSCVREGARTRRCCHGDCTSTGAET